MKVLVIGSGAREHAIAHALMRGGSVSEVTVAPVSYTHLRAHET